MQEASPHRALGGSEVKDWLADPEFQSRRMEVPGAQVIYQPKDAAIDAYYLESGQVRVYQIGANGVLRLAGILGPGAWFGIGALARQSNYGSRAEVVSPSVVWAIAGDRLLKRIADQTAMAADLITQLASRLRSAHEAAALLMFEDTNQRLVRTLIEFSQTSAAVPHEEGVLLHITHQQLAQAVGAARETVSLALTQLRQQHLLRTGRNRLTFNPAALRQFSDRRLEGASLEASPKAPATAGHDVSQHSK
ncbi:MAG TPA: Crp/Fnr family transcriptional regulator [Tepidisphaeraceae bacterium]|jgi:CRP/FNR family transcriptional regulator